MPTVNYDSPIGILSITEEDGYITRVYAIDEPLEVTQPETPVLKLAVEQFDEYFAGKRLIFDLPLKQGGTTFQQGVWDELCRIDFGKTISYQQQQSKFMNNPLGIRAIASANGKNNLLIVVPCHRVIGTDGSLTGFGAGIWRKKWLLEHEARVLGVGQTSLF
jgi:methylated-DNA-[protein]-cysteine S-methyltransferase